MASEWYENYFDEIYLRSYGWRLDRAPAETETILRLLDLPSGASILDLGCGQGRHVVELARRGYQVTGLDLSRVLLQKAQELAQKMGVGVELVEEDMRRIPETWAARFDGIINVFTTWGYFDKDTDNERVIEGVARSLRLGGRFLLDVLNRDWLIRHLRMRAWREGDEGIITVENVRLNLPKSQSETDITVIFPDGHRVVRSARVRLYTLAEIIGIFQRYGLTVRETYGDWAAREYGLDSPRLIVLATRER